MVKVPLKLSDPYQNPPAPVGFAPSGPDMLIADVEIDPLVIVNALPELVVAESVSAPLPVTDAPALRIEKCI